MTQLCTSCLELKMQIQALEQRMLEIECALELEQSRSRMFAMLLEEVKTLIKLDHRRV